MFCCEQWSAAPLPNVCQCYPHTLFFSPSSDIPPPFGWRLQILSVAWVSFLRRRGSVRGTPLSSVLLLTILWTSSSPKIIFKEQEMSYCFISIVLLSYWSFLRKSTKFANFFKLVAALGVKPSSQGFAVLCLIVRPADQLLLVFNCQTAFS